MIYLYDKTPEIFTRREEREFSCNLIVDVNILPLDPEDHTILSDWIYSQGHGGGDNRRVSGKAWWLNKDNLKQVETEKI